MNAVILEISDICIKTGFAGNSSPANVTWLKKEFLSSAVLTSAESLERTRTALRAIIRQVFREKLLLNFKSQRIICVDPNYEFPIRHMLIRLFLRDLRASSITFLPVSICTTIGAGVREGIIIEIGWHSISVIAIGDLREMEQLQTIRGVKWMLQSCSKAEVSNIDSLVCPIVASFLDYKGAFLDEDKHNDIEEKSVLQLISLLLKSLDHATRALLIQNIIFNSSIAEVPSEIKNAVTAALQSEGYAKISPTSSLGSWRGCSLYMSSVPWGAQGLKIPGEIKREDRKSLAGEMAGMNLKDK